MPARGCAREPPARAAAPVAGRRDGVMAPVTDRTPGRLLRRPGLFWMWVHVPVTLARYGPAILSALSSVPESYQPGPAALLRGPREGTRKRRLMPHDPVAHAAREQVEGAVALQLEADVLACVHSGSRTRLIATVHDPRVIRRILGHLALAHSGRSPGPARDHRRDPAVRLRGADEMTSGESSSGPERQPSATARTGASPFARASQRSPASPERKTQPSSVPMTTVRPRAARQPVSRLSANHSGSPA